MSKPMQGVQHAPRALQASIGGIQVEYVLAEHMVVFSHGFGVRRDARGMFSDLTANLPVGYGFVLFDYNPITDNTVTITGPVEQAATLKKVLAWTYRQTGVRYVTLIGHSMGAIAVALAMPVGVDSIILLAPPLTIGETTRSYFMNKPGIQKGDTAILVPRSDGTTSIIKYEMFTEFESTDAQATIEALAAVHPLTIVEATREEILTGTDYSKITHAPGISHVALPADHNFTGTARPKLLKAVNKILVGQHGR